MNPIVQSIPWIIANCMRVFRLALKHQLLLFFLACVLLLLTGLYKFEQSILKPESDVSVQSVAPLVTHHLRANTTLPYITNSSLTLWSSDFHISPIADIKYILSDYKVNIIDKSLSGHCHLSNSCETDLKVLNKQNGIHLSTCANKVRKDFYRAYRTDSQLLSSDGFLCNHATSMCEVFMPFGRPLIVIASTRYEIGRHDQVSWSRWNDNLKRIASNPMNTVAANNKYDQEYMKYFTDITNIELIPNFCNYVNTRYAPTKKEVLIAPSRGVSPVLSRLLNEGLAKFNNMQLGMNHLTLSPIRELYPVHFEYSDIASHPAIVVLPYQVSLMSIFEFYRMEIPMFVPSPRLLAQWHVDYRVLNERTWSGVFGQPSEHSVLSKHKNSTSTMQFDPNNEFSYDAILEWISLADFYVWPHIVQFNTFEELFQLLLTGTTKAGIAVAQQEYKTKHGLNMDFLGQISAKMHEYNVIEEANIRDKWQNILNKVHTHKTVQRANKSVVLPLDINVALQKEYGVVLASNNCDLQHEAT